MSIDAINSFRYASNAFYRAQGNNGFKQAGLNAEIQKMKSDQETVSDLSDEQKEYLRNKYSLADLDFIYDKPGDVDESLIETSSASDNFMRDLLQMGLITQNEYKSYMNPTMWVQKPLNYDSLPEHVKLGFKDDPLISHSNPTELSRMLSKNVSGENLLEAFQALSAQQKRSSELALGMDDKERYANEAEMYKRLASLLGDIFSR